MNLLDLSEIVIRTGMRSTVELDEPALEDPDLRFAEPIVGRVEFQNSGDLLNLNGTVHTVLEIECSRCMADVRVPIDLTIDEHLPLAQVTNPTQVLDEEEGIDTFIASIVHLDQGRPILNLDELIRQQIWSDVPMRALCDSACRGLCPRCGVDLNQGACVCAPDPGDSPLSGLASLLDRDPEADGSR